jgi:hypothetical protein
MALVKGKDGVLTVQGHDSDDLLTGSATSVLKMTEWSLSEETGVAEGRVMGEATIRRHATYSGWSGSVNVLYDPADPGQTLALVAGAYLEAVFMPQGNAVGNVSKTGKAYVTAVEFGQSTDEWATAAVTLQGDGLLVTGTL